MSGTRIVGIQYKGAGPAMQATVADPTQLILASDNTRRPMLQAGRLRFADGDEHQTAVSMSTQRQSQRRQTIARWHRCQHQAETAIRAGLDALVGQTLGGDFTQPFQQEIRTDKTREQTKDASDTAKNPSIFFTVARRSCCRVARRSCNPLINC